MKLTKINYGSAMFFGVITLIMYLALAVLQWSLRSYFAQQGIVITGVQTFVITPIVGAIVGYVVAIVVIAIYNLVAMKYPIGWTVSK